MPSHHNVIMILYDLPSSNASEKKLLSDFRKNLRRCGYQMLQKSVYVKLVRNRNNVKSEINRLYEITPNCGDVKVLPLSLGEFNRLTELSGETFDMRAFSGDMIII